MKHHRLARVAEAIREVASEAILFEVRDPRIKFTTVTRAEVSADLQHAKVYVSVMGSERDRTLTLHGLRSAAGFIQSKLGDRMKSRFVPVLEFVLDEGLKNSMEVNRLLNEEKARSQESEGSGPESEDGPEPVADDEAPAPDKLTPDS
ncbi:MAG TPA: 30S ribosome-binding factor RbfA [Gemmataceae bacterium]|jgi:ribosome-binding factor A|nr:30S ribosome-binding factor RbfA [Gemmataceae bacterium]